MMVDQLLVVQKNISKGSKYDFEGWTMGVVWTDWKGAKEPKNHSWNAASPVQKEVFFASNRIHIYIAKDKNVSLMMASILEIKFLTIFS